MSKTKAKTSPKKKAAKKAEKGPLVKRFRPTLAEYRTALEKIESLQADLECAQSRLNDVEASNRNIREDLYHQEAQFRGCQKAVKEQIQIANGLRDQIMQLKAQNIQAANLLEDAYAKTLERTPERQAKITEIIKNDPRKYKIS